MWARPSEVGGKEGLYKVYSSKTRLKGSRISWLGFHGCVEGLGWLGNLIGKGLRVYILWYKYNFGTLRKSISRWCGHGDWTDMVDLGLPELMKPWRGFVARISRSS